MARMNGVDEMSVAQLLDLQKKIEAAIVERRATEAREVKEQMQAMAEKSGFSLAELFGGKRGKRGPSSIKYRNPKDTSQTWTGRGRKPNWLVAALKKGAKIESFGV
jgi:DNA-binding protein H-NS